jgi:hypothetical protein
VFQTAAPLLLDRRLLGNQMADPSQEADIAAANTAAASQLVKYSSFLLQLLIDSSYLAACQTAAPSQRFLTGLRCSFSEAASQGFVNVLQTIAN